MINQFRLLFPEYCIYPVLVGDVGNKSNKPYFCVYCNKLSFKLIQGRFSLINGNDTFRMILNHLFNQLFSNRSGCTGNANAFTLEIPFNVLNVQSNRLPTKQVLNIYLFNLVEAQFSLSPLINGWDQSDSYLMLNAAIHKLISSLHANIFGCNNQLIKRTFIQ